MSADDLIAKAGAALHQAWFAPRLPGIPNRMPQNDLNPNAADLAFQVQLLSGRVQQLETDLAEVQRIFRELAQRGNRNTR